VPTRISSKSFAVAGNVPDQDAITSYLWLWITIPSVVVAVGAALLIIYCPAAPKTKKNRNMLLKTGNNEEINGFVVQRL